MSSGAPGFASARARAGAPGVRRAPGPTRAAWLLIALRLARLRNQALSGMQRLRRAKRGGPRAAAPGKSRIGWILGSLIAASMVASFTNLARQAVANFAEQLGSVPQPAAAAREYGWLGISSAPLTAAEAQALGLAEPRGAKVSGSVPGSPAAAAGLRAGDLLLAVDGRPVAGPEGLTALISAKAPGSVTEIGLLRDGKEQHLTVRLARRPAPANAQARRLPLPAAPGRQLAIGTLQACALEAAILALAALLACLASRELARPDWDLEWLAILPVPLPTLVFVRILERTLVNPTGLLALWPFLSVVAWQSGHRLAAPLLGFAAALPLLLIIAAIWTVGDTGLRLAVRPQRLRNLQAVISVAAVALLYFAMSAGLAKGSYVVSWAPAMPATVFMLPPGLAIDAVALSTTTAAAMALLVLSAQAILCAAAALLLLRVQLRSGIVAAAGRESGRKEWRGALGIGSRGAVGDRRLLSPIQAREGLLLLRDRNFLVQTLILPIVIMGGQIVFAAPQSAFAFAFSSPQHVAAAAFGVAAYALMFSAFQTLNAEGQALWILYCVPRPLAALLREKALLWGSVCLLYAAGILGVYLALNPRLSLTQLQQMLVVLAGVPVFATIGVSLGVFACDPLAQEVQRRIRASYLYLYMLLASLYAYAIYASDVWQCLPLVVLTALLAVALWQKARDHLPYLLDPAASPPARVAAADGLIAALLFFVLQGLTLHFLSLAGAAAGARALVIAFLVAGAASYGVMRIAYWRLGTSGVPEILPARLAPSLATGVALGATAACAGLLYLALLAKTSLFAEARRSVLVGGDGLLWFALLGVVAAPIFEEFIFRGLIFSGLRRSLPLAASLLLSAGIFALVHPPPSVIPVFLLGVAAAVAYERTRALLAPMLVHGLYNAAVIAYPVLIR
jgi:ABC-2 type transport system permease protein